MLKNKYPYVLFIALLGLIFIGCSGSPKIEQVVYHAEVYFSPEGHTQERIIKAIDESKSSIDLAIFDLTAPEIKAAFERAKQRGIKIRIIADSRQAKGVYSIIQSLIDQGFNVRIRHGKGGGIMHNKFAVFDNKLLFIGSYNWTNNAEHNNYENAIFLTDPETIARYQIEFDSIWNSNPAEIPVSKG